MSDQPEALRLADILEKMPFGECDEQAAAELRRLHNENQAAHAAGIQQEREMMVLEAEVERLRAGMLAWQNASIDIGQQLKKTEAEVERLRAELARLTTPTQEQSDAYDAIDRTLRNLYDDEAYAEYSAMLDTLWSAPPPEPKEADK